MGITQDLVRILQVGSMQDRSQEDTEFGPLSERHCRFIGI